MNNKYFKYFLLLAAVGVWATIMYRVVHGLGGSDIPDAVRVTTGQKMITPDIDTFQLYADYPDPFLSASDTTAPSAASSKDNNLIVLPLAPATAPAKEEKVSDIIQYTGFICNIKKRLKVAIIMMRGKEYLVKENDIISDVRIRKIERTKLWITYKGAIFTLDLLPKAEAG